MNEVLPIGNVLFNTSRIGYRMYCNYDGYGSSLILIKQCKSLVRAVVAHFVDGFVDAFVELFVVYLVKIIVLFFVDCAYCC